MTRASLTIIAIVTIIVHVDLMLVDTWKTPRSKEAAVDAEFMELEDLDIPHLVRKDQVFYNNCRTDCQYQIDIEVTEHLEPMEYITYEPQKCQGWLHHCYTVTNGENGEYCTFDGKLVWVGKFDGYRSGPNDDTCTKGNFLGAPRVWGELCGTCLCMCTEGSLDRTDTTWAVNLQPRTSDVGNHKIIVGLKFRMEKKMIWLDIKEGQLDSSDEGDWRTIDGTKVSRREVDYNPLAPKTRSIQLGLITLPRDYVVTGVKFSKIPSLSSWQESTLGLEVQGTKVDLLKHELIPSSSKWFNSADKDRFTTSRTKYIIFEDVGWRNGERVRIFPLISQRNVESKDNRPLEAAGLTNEWIRLNEHYIKPEMISSNIRQRFVEKTIGTQTPGILRTFMRLMHFIQQFCVQKKQST